jgi:hypothetical protein
MRRLLLFSLALAVAAAVSPCTAYAGPVVVDSGWYRFCFGPSGTPAHDCNDPDAVSVNPWTFYSAQPVWVNVTDAFIVGDSFTVSIDGIPFTTPSVRYDDFWTEQPDIAFASPVYSHGSWLLGAGFHSVDVFALDSPFEGGGAFLEATTSVPDSGSSLLLLGMGFAGLRAWKRRLG